MFETSRFQLLVAYADDIALIARRLPDPKEFFIRLAQLTQDRTLRSAITTSSV
jgi:hypothetical protein